MKSIYTAALLLVVQASFVGAACNDTLATPPTEAAEGGSLPLADAGTEASPDADASDTWPELELRFVPVALARVPSLFAVGVNPLRALVVIGTPDELSVHPATGYYGSYAWQRPTRLTREGAATFTRLHGIQDAPTAEPRVYVESSDSTVRLLTAETIHPPVRFCEDDTQSSCASAVSVVGIAAAVWVVRSASQLSFYRSVGPELAVRLAVPAVGDVAEVLGPIAEDEDLRLLVRHPSGAWDYVRVDPSTPGLGTLPVENPGELTHLARGADRNERKSDVPHVWRTGAEAGEARLDVGQAGVSLTTVLPSAEPGAPTWYGRSMEPYFEGIRDSCTLHAQRVQCWRDGVASFDPAAPEAREALAAAFFGYHFAVLLPAETPGFYALKMQNRGPNPP